jgi:hypothetical protein
MEPEALALLDETISALTASSDGEVLTEALDRFGWLELLANDPETAVRTLFAAQGRAVAWSSALHDVLGMRLSELGVGAHPKTTAVVVPRPRDEAPGRSAPSGVTVDGLLIGARATTEWLVATSVDSDGRHSVLRLPNHAAVIERRYGLDPAAGVQRVSADATDAESVLEGAAASVWWAESVSIARRALSHQLCGVLGCMIELARAHAIERQQFGRAIGSFQAVRHKLAEAHVAVVGAAETADFAWASDDPLAAATAKLVAGRAATFVTAHTQQVLAGVGFTAEHPFHRAMKRAVSIDRLLGSASELASVVGRELADRGCAPRLAEL